MLTNAAHDPKTGRSEFVSKRRGIDDCGAIGRYAWTGAAFVRIAFGMTSNHRIQLHRGMVG